MKEMVSFFKLNTSHKCLSYRPYKRRVFNKLLSHAAVTWLTYCRYGVKHYPTNQPINQSINHVIYFPLWNQSRVNRSDSLCADEVLT